MSRVRTSATGTDRAKDRYALRYATTALKLQVSSTITILLGGVKEI